MAFVGLLALGLAQFAVADPTTIESELGAAGNYAVLGLGNPSASSDFLSVYQSATVINGNVGMGPDNNWGHGIDATINGRVDYDTTDSAPTVTGTVTGGLHQTSMTSAVKMPPLRHRAYQVSGAHSDARLLAR